jgi:hypothetical protein
MADPVVTQTQSKFPRNELAAALARDNPRMIKALEALFMDVGKTLPDAIDSQSDESILLASITADTSRSAAFSSAQLADQVMALDQTTRAQRTAITALVALVAELQTQVFSLTRAQSSALTAMRRDIDDTRTLVQGI